MVKVTAAQAQKQFGRFGEIAQREPVSITNHGRDSLVLLSAVEYARLKAMDSRQSFFAWEMPEAFVKALETAEPPAWTAKFNDELEP